MKKSRIILSVLLIIFVLGAWAIQGLGLAQKTGGYKASSKEADQYMEKGLFQKAIAAYDEALSVNEDKTTRAKWIKAYKSGYKDKVVDSDDYAAAMEKMCELYPKDAKNWESLLSFYVKSSDFYEGHRAVKRCLREGVTSDKLEKLINDIEYSFSLNSTPYRHVTCSADCYYRTFDDMYWGMMGPSGEWLIESDYLNAGPAATGGYIYISSEKDNRVLNAERVVQHIFTKKLEETRAYGSGLIPVQEENETWKVFDCEKDKLRKTEYDDLSSFTDGLAVAKKGSSWTLIGTDEKQVSKTPFDDVKLFSNGEYVYNDIMVASEKGKYGLYHADGSEIMNIGAKDMDCYYGGLIAFQDQGGKWGFIDAEGNVVLKPKYNKAKSFSGGLAAVSNGKEWGFINEAGDLVIDYQYLDAFYFSQEGVCMVSTMPDLYYLVELRFPKSS